MASRPLAFGVRFKDKGRTVRVLTKDRKARRFVLEDSRPGAKARRREHGNLSDVLRDFASTWRGRLN